jgi:CheY-like chemotaxis protein
MILLQTEIKLSCQSILIVEDEKDIRESLKMLLELEGYSVFTAKDGKEGLEILKNLESPCLILLDLLMPVMNGM